MIELPEPDVEAQAASRELTAHLLAQVDEAGGWLGFDAFMHGALYEPGMGYYTGGSRKFGHEGDFVTAPQLSPLFGACIAAQCARWFDAIGRRQLVEFGAGTGQLAAQVLNALARAGIDDVDYRIVELSAPLRQVQRHTLETLAPEALPRVDWLDRLPDALEAVVLGNELVDAMPVRLFRLEGAHVFERGVERAPGVEIATLRPLEPAFRFADRPADADFAQKVLAALASAGWGGPQLPPKLAAWPDGYQSELAEQARGWMASVGERLRRGVVLLIDYGFPASEYFHPQRAGGTLACHYRHRVHHDPLVLVGLQDLTAHVDFSALASHAAAVGLDCLGFASQGSFLLGAGVLDLLGHAAEPGTPAYLQQAQAVGQLVSEAEMGELFKVIAFGRGGPFDTRAFERGDRRAALFDPAPR